MLAAAVAAAFMANSLLETGTLRMHGTVPRLPRGMLLSLGRKRLLLQRDSFLASEASIPKAAMRFAKSAPTSRSGSPRKPARRRTIGAFSRAVVVAGMRPR